MSEFNHTVDHGSLLFPRQLADLTKGNLILVNLWLREGMPKYPCSFCIRFDPNVVLPWLREHNFTDEQGHARRWRDARPRSH